MTFILFLFIINSLPFLKPGDRFDVTRTWKLDIRSFDIQFRFPWLPCALPGKSFPILRLFPWKVDSSLQQDLSWLSCCRTVEDQLSFRKSIIHTFWSLRYHVYVEILKSVLRYNPLHPLNSLFLLVIQILRELSTCHLCENLPLRLPLHSFLIWPPIENRSAQWFHVTISLIIYLFSWWSWYHNGVKPLRLHELIFFPMFTSLRSMYISN